MVPSILVGGLELEISLSLQVLCPMGPLLVCRLKPAPSVMAVCIPVWLAFCHLVLKVYNHGHVNRPSWWVC